MFVVCWPPLRVSRAITLRVRSEITWARAQLPWYLTFTGWPRS
jgi:hypothetical protein